MPDPCLPTYDSLTSLDEQLPHHDGGHEHRHEHAFQRPRVPRKVSKPLAIPSIPAKRSRQNTAMSTMSTNSSHASASQLCLPETLPILEQIQRDLDELLPRMKVEYYLNVDQLISWHQRDVQDRNMSEERQEEIRKRKANGEDLKVFCRSLNEVLTYASRPTVVGDRWHDIPFLVYTCVEELYRTGLYQPGLFRLFPNRPRFEDLRNEFDTDEPETRSRLPFHTDSPLRMEPIPNICALLYTYLKCLPHPIIEPPVYHALWAWCVASDLSAEDEDFAQRTSVYANNNPAIVPFAPLMRRLSVSTSHSEGTTRRSSSSSEGCPRIALAQHLLHLLPCARFSLLVYLLMFFSQVVLMREENGMSLVDVGDMFGLIICGPIHGQAGSEVGSTSTTPGASAGGLDTNHSKTRATLTLTWLLNRWGWIAERLFDIRDQYTPEALEKRRLEEERQRKAEEEEEEGRGRPKPRKLLSFSALRKKSTENVNASPSLKHSTKTPKIEVTPPGSISPPPLPKHTGDSPRDSPLSATANATPKADPLRSPFALYSLSASPCSSSPRSILRNTGGPGPLSVPPHQLSGPPAQITTAHHFASHNSTGALNASRLRYASVDVSLSSATKGGGGVQRPNTNEPRRASVQVGRASLSRPAPATTQGLGIQPTIVEGRPARFEHAPASSSSFSSFSSASSASSSSATLSRARGRMRSASQGGWNPYDTIKASASRSQRPSLPVDLKAPYEASRGTQAGSGSQSGAAAAGLANSSAKQGGGSNAYSSKDSPSGLDLRCLGDAPPPPSPTVPATPRVGYRTAPRKQKGSCSILSSHHLEERLGDIDIQSELDASFDRFFEGFKHEDSPIPEESRTPPPALEFGPVEAPFSSAAVDNNTHRHPRDTDKDAGAGAGAEETAFKPLPNHERTATPAAVTDSELHDLRHQHRKSLKLLQKNQSRIQVLEQELERNDAVVTQAIQEVFSWRSQCTHLQKQIRQLEREKVGLEDKVVELVDARVQMGSSTSTSTNNSRTSRYDHGHDSHGHKHHTAMTATTQSLRVGTKKAAGREQSVSEVEEMVRWQREKDELLRGKVRALEKENQELKKLAAEWEAGNMEKEMKALREQLKTVARERDEAVKLVTEIRQAVRI